LRSLALNGGRLVPKKELLNGVWANVAVTDVIWNEEPPVTFLAW
jgi:hypothetical protein